MKIIHNQYDNDATALLKNDKQYTEIVLNHSQVTSLFSPKPLSERNVFTALRENLPLSKDASPFDVVLPNCPLSRSMDIWHKERIGKLGFNRRINRQITEYFSKSDLRLDHKVSLIKVCYFIAQSVNYRHWCSFYNSKDIATFTGLSTTNVSRCIEELEAKELLSIIVCRSKYRRKIAGSYIKVTETFKSLFLNGIEWLDSEPLYHYTESDYLKHLHEIERVGRELQSLIQRQYYPERVINHAYFLLTG